MIEDGYTDHFQLGHLLIDMRILTADDREDLLQTIYDLYESEDN